MISASNHQFFFSLHNDCDNFVAWKKLRCCSSSFYVCVSVAPFRFRQQFVVAFVAVEKQKQKALRNDSTQKQKSNEFSVRIIAAACR